MWHLSILVFLKQRIKPIIPPFCDASYVNRHGYEIGQRAWRTLRDQRFKEGDLPKTRREWEQSRKGGPPTKLSSTALAVTRSVLENNSKPGSKVANVHRNDDGTFGQPRRRGDQANETMVPSQSLLATPARMYAENEEIRKHFSRSQFYKVLKTHFAEYREGHRDTDVCSHCQCYFKHLAPRFHKDWKQIQTDLAAVYPAYFAHFDTTREYADCGEEADAACKYIARHSERYQEARAQSGCDLLQLHTFTEAPALVLLRGHRSLLKSYLWHMLSARRQQECLKKLMVPEGLPRGDTLLVFDWREKLRLPLGPQETGDMWHAQQKYAISCLGCCVFRWTKPQRGSPSRFQQTYVMLLSEIREQTAEASNLMLDEVVKMVDVSTDGCLHLFSDCGPHFRSAESLHHHVMEFCFKRRQEVRVNYLGEQHGKSLLDGAFGTTGMHGWIGEYAREGPVHTIQQLLEAFQDGGRRAMKRDPQGPQWMSSLVDFGQYRATEVGVLRSSEMRITRTYALVALKPARLSRKPVIYNLVFTDMQQPRESLAYEISTQAREGNLEWKRAYFEGEKTWEMPPPDPSDTTQLSRRHEEQKMYPPRGDLKPVRSFEERVQAKARRAARNKVRLQRQTAALRGIPALDENDSSSSDQQQQQRQLKNARCHGLHVVRPNSVTLQGQNVTVRRGLSRKRVYVRRCISAENVYVRRCINEVFLQLLLRLLWLFPVRLYVIIVPLLILRRRRRLLLLLLLLLLLCTNYIYHFHRRSRPSTR